MRSHASKHPWPRHREMAERASQEGTDEFVKAAEAQVTLARQEQAMHYRNGREAKNGDKVVSLAGYGSGPVNINAIGILFDATPGNDYCNGGIAPITGGVLTAACLCDCLHYDDVIALIVEKGWDKRPAGK
jgi:hypothetical protein